jgi:hypothetical protein
MAVVGGLSLNCVQRLKKTWDGVPRQSHATFTSLVEFVSGTSNFKNYRSVLKDSPKPVLPYLAVLLKDILFIEEGNPNMRPNGMVNFEKMAMLSKAFSMLKDYQSCPFKFPENFEILDLLSSERLQFDVIKDDKQLYKLSTMKEPVGGVRLASHSLPDTKAERAKFNPNKQEVPVVSASESKKKTIVVSTAVIGTPKKIVSGMKKTLKIVLAGDGAVGKTCMFLLCVTLVFRFVDYVYDEGVS